MTDPTIPSLHQKRKQIIRDIDCEISPPTLHSAEDATVSKFNATNEIANLVLDMCRIWARRQLMVSRA